MRKNIYTLFYRLILIEGFLTLYNIDCIKLGFLRRINESNQKGEAGYQSTVSIPSEDKSENKGRGAVILRNYYRL